MLEKMIEDWKDSVKESVKSVRLPLEIHSKTGNYSAEIGGWEGTSMSLNLERFNSDAVGESATLEIKIPFWKEPILIHGTITEKKIVRSKSQDRITDNVLLFESDAIGVVKKFLPKFPLDLKDWKIQDWKLPEFPKKAG
ncbi:hypothetical protein CH379_006510 [Leptospira ellisii]|uniref:Uncharacterized protein n=1 Tax=Leptospira ellisii TaxID=2023197 RepID=A0A2N0BD88_9LEPT|nr:hypothetical protein [Leptospira ellisii]MDV6235276.1 hypothetical protein [Leptospira ellisii]PJZ94421.1 hypothetical protein CH379_02825 [Leptospira ellisii]PKA06089.1 hypothetical protein CH375_01635 [Leptospira ellisii]